MNNLYCMQLLERILVCNIIYIFIRSICLFDRVTKKGKTQRERRGEGTVSKQVRTVSS